MELDQKSIPKYVAEIELTREELDMLKKVLTEEKERSSGDREKWLVIDGLLCRLSLRG